MIRQRLRGILGITIAVCIPWIGLGLLASVIFRFQLIPGIRVFVARPIPGGIITACVLAGALIGVVNGLTFSSLVLATEHGKNVEELRAWRFATWGAVATAGTVGIMIHSSLLVGIGALLGAVGGIAVLRTARRQRVDAASALATLPEQVHISIDAPST
jgi:uncharacterized membrane protein